MKTISIILAGGRGTRFWPISRRNKPKQLLNIFTGRPLLIEAFERARKFSEKIVVITSSQLEEQVRNLLGSQVDILAEPIGKNTAPAIYYTLRTMDYISDDDVIVVMPADHVIGNVDTFLEDMSKAKKYASKGYIVVFGVKPDRPETGYGYIEVDEKKGLLEEGVYKALKFYEKPSREKAVTFVEAGNFYWNAGMFIFTKKTMLKAYEIYAPDIVRTFESSNTINEFYYAVRDVSIDFAIMEKAENIVLVKANFYWEDVGSYIALERLHKFETTESGNATFGNNIVLRTENSIIYSEDGICAVYGIKDMIVVHTRDVTLVIPKKYAQEVKRLVEEARKRGFFDYL